MPLIVIVMVVIGAFFTGSELVKTQNNPVVIEKVRTLQIPTPTPTNPPTPTPANIPQVKGESVQREPVIDCIGPDGVHFKTSQKECTDFNNAWKKPQPSNTPSVPAQISTQTVTSSEPLVTCVLSYGTYQLTRATCDSWKSTDKPYNPPQYYSCTLCYSALGICSTYNSLYKTKEECDVAQKDLNQSGNSWQTQYPSAAPLPTKDPYCDTALANWKGFEENFNATQINNYSSSVEGVRALYGYMQSYQKQADVHNCGVTLYL